MREVLADAAAELERLEPRRVDVGRARLAGDDDRNRALLERVNAGGDMFISHAVLNGRYVLRLAIGNLWTTIDDVRRAWDVLVREAAGV